MKIGDTASYTKTITDEDIRLFAQVSGDENPLHMDEAYAATTQFKQRIAHGVLTGSLISAVLGNELPGTGAIYLSQNYQFKAPVFIGDTITATVELVKLREDKPIGTFKTTCVNQDGTLVIDGEAVMLVPK